MITEKGTVLVRTPVDAQVQSEVNKGTSAFGIVAIVLGGILLVAYFSYLFVTLVTAAYRSNLVLLLLGAVLLVSGIIITVNTSKLNRQMALRNVVDEVEFFSGYCILREFVSGEHISTCKIYYSRVIKKRETANYLLIFNTAVTAAVVGKRGLPVGELQTIKRLLGLMGGGVQQPPYGAQQPPYGAQPPYGTQQPPYGVPPYGAYNGGAWNGNGGGNANNGANGGAGETPPPDPFGDMNPHDGSSGGKTL